MDLLNETDIETRKKIVEVAQRLAMADGLFNKVKRS